VWTVEKQTGQFVQHVTIDTRLPDGRRLKPHSALTGCLLVTVFRASVCDDGYATHPA
jgi:hypothetical protein